MSIGPTRAADYSGLPGWYLADLIRPRLIQIALEDDCKGSDDQLVTAGGSLLALRGGPSKSYMNDLANNRIGICGLQMVETILEACGIHIAGVREDMFIPVPGYRNALRMASDELYALRLPPTEASLLARADYLANRRDLLMNLRPR